MDKTCGTCRWWKANEEATRGDCRRFPPTIFVVDRGLHNEIRADFPGTTASIFCGEHSDKEPSHD